MSHDLIKGSMVAMVTPFKDGKIDEESLKGLIDFQIENGTDVVIPCGTTGESATMSHEEHRYLMDFTKEYVDGRVPIICGAGSNNTEEALGLVQHAKKVGAAAALVVTPYYNKPSQEGLYRHYEFLAKKVDIPIILYNVPGRTGVSLNPETVARLARIDTIAAVKEASGDLGAVDKILSLCDINVLSGDDGLTFPMMAIGAVGAISVTANVVPKLHRDMVHAALNQDMASARKFHQEHLDLANVLFVESNPVPVKTALSMMGKLNLEFRLPLCEMRPENVKRVKMVLESMGLISEAEVGA